MANTIDYSAAQKAVAELQAELAALPQNDVTRHIQQFVTPVVNALEKAIDVQEHQKALDAARATA